MIQGATGGAYLLVLSDALGQVVWQTAFREGCVRLEKGSLGPGLYGYQVLDRQGAWQAGGVLSRQ